jgi:hypothetical protein
MQDALALSDAGKLPCTHNILQPELHQCSTDCTQTSKGSQHAVGVDDATSGAVGKHL